MNRFVPSRFDVTTGVTSATPLSASLASRIISSVTDFSMAVSSSFFMTALTVQSGFLIMKYCKKRLIFVKNHFIIF